MTRPGSSEQIYGQIPTADWNPWIERKWGNSPGEGRRRFRVPPKHPFPTRTAPLPVRLLGKSFVFLIIATLATPGFSASAAPSSIDTPPGAVRDEHSYAEPEAVVIKHLALDLAMDFVQKALAGSATVQLDWKDPAARSLVLDTRALHIERVEAAEAAEWTEAPFDLAPADPVLGQKLTVRLARQLPKVRVHYRTSPSASGLQWLTPPMTLGKNTPFMFSQSQQIHARSWVPLQDTPRVRFTYEARVRSPSNVMVLMSADNDPNAARDGEYSFRMPQAIPSYLLAIAAGDLVFQRITDRIGVWAEPAMAPKAAAEFADTGRMMETAETLYGPYRWGRYDILVLPPSFPYGGMENPRLTFATPTIITGDKSLVSLIAHELAHSWSGNLVTFALTRDAWLNEGVTTYVENRLIEALFGRERAEMEISTARNELRNEFTEQNRNLQALSLKPGALPDPDGYLVSTVYIKGAWFMHFLEHRFGRAVFDDFLRSYFDHFAFQSITTRQFQAYAQTHLLRAHPGKVTEEELETWLYGPGIPASAPQVASRRLDAVEAARSAWLRTGTLPDRQMTSAWTTHEWIHFIEGMPDKLSGEQIKALDAAYRFIGTPNGEIAQRWYPLVVRSGYTEARHAIADFLSRIGRRKLIMPTYKALAATPDGLAFAREVFAKSRPGLHPITVGSVEAALAPK